MSCAEGAAIGRNLRHVGGRACILRQNRQRDKYNVRRRDAALYGMLALEYSSSARIYQ
jgi:hypothetical protein